MAKPYIPAEVPLEHLAEPIPDGSELGEDELRELNDALDESAAQFSRGEGISSEVVLAEMRQILYGG